MTRVGVFAWLFVFFALTSVGLAYEGFFPSKDRGVLFFGCKIENLCSVLAKVVASSSLSMLNGSVLFA
jgi:hypothetical protein